MSEQRLTSRQAAIVTAYTDVLTGEFGDFHKYAGELMNRPVFTSELGSGPIRDHVQELSRQDFMNICNQGEKMPPIPSPENAADLNNRFSFHPADTEAKATLHEDVRAVVRDAADYVTENIQPSRELSLALTKLEEAMFWANAAVARMDEMGNRL